MLNMENIHWFCGACNSVIGRVLPTLAKLEMKQTKLEDELKVITVDVLNVKSKCEKTITDMETMKSHHYMLADDINTLKKDIDTQFVRVAENISEVKGLMTNTKSDLYKFVDDKFSLEEDDANENTWVKVAGKHVDARLGQVASQVQTMQKALQDSKDAVKEEQDKEARRNNIIIYRVPESDALLADDRYVEDKRFCEQLLFSLNVGIADEDIRRVFRLGRRDTNVSGTRPILVQLGSHTAKNLVMENLFKLKSLADKFKDVVIAHDMTKKERDACIALVNTAKLKNDNETGEWIYRVRGLPGRMKIVQLRKTR